MTNRYETEDRPVFAHPPAQAGAVTEVAEIIYRAYGFDPASKTETADGTPYGNWAKAVKAARQLAAALGAQTPPEGAVTEAQGWRLVPEEPTEAMYAAAEREWDGRMSARVAGVWKAMLAAAPTPLVNQSEGADRG